MLVVRISCINALATTPEIPIPEDVQLYAWEVSGIYENVTPALLLSLVYQESRGTGKNLTQIMNAKWFREGMDATGSTDLTNPYENMNVCAYYLDKWISKYGAVDIALECWNEGEDTAIRTHGNKPSRYANSIINRTIEYQNLIILNVGREDVIHE